jgi:hypothetical protein
MAERITHEILPNGGIIFKDENGNTLPPEPAVLGQFLKESIANGYHNAMDYITPQQRSVAPGQLGSPDAAQAVQDNYQAGGTPALGQGVVPSQGYVPTAVQNNATKRETIKDLMK